MFFEEKKFSYEKNNNNKIKAAVPFNPSLLFINKTKNETSMFCLYLLRSFLISNCVHDLISM